MILAETTWDKVNHKPQEFFSLAACLIAVCATYLNLVQARTEFETRTTTWPCSKIEGTLTSSLSKRKLLTNANTYASVLTLPQSRSSGTRHTSNLKPPLPRKLSSAASTTSTTTALALQTVATSTARSQQPPKLPLKRSKWPTKPSTILATKPKNNPKPSASLPAAEAPTGVEQVVVAATAAVVVVDAVGAATAASTTASTAVPPAPLKRRTKRKLSATKHTIAGIDTIDELITEFKTNDIPTLSPLSTQADTNTSSAVPDIELLRVTFPGLVGFSANALIDSGSIGENANIVSAEIANTLISLNMATPSQHVMSVCDFNNNCEEYNQHITFPFSYQSERNDKWKTITMTATVSKRRSAADIIIGRKVIIENNMCRHTFSHFKKVTPEHAERLQARPLHFPPSKRARTLTSLLTTTESTNGTLPVPQHKKVSWAAQPVSGPCLGSCSIACTTCAQASAHSTYSTAISDSVEKEVPSPMWDSCRCVGGAQCSPDTDLPFCTLCTLIVSKAQLLEGLEDDDDDIDELPELPLGNETFTLDDLDVSSIDDDAFDKEHLDILTKAFDTDQIFQQDLGNDAIKVDPFTLNVDDTQWTAEARNHAAPRKLSTERRKFVDETVNMLLEKGCIERAQVKAYSQVHVQPKKNPGEFRLCIDFRGLNDATTRISWPIPNIKAMLSRLGEKKPKYFAVMDLTSGYWQTMMHEDSRDHTAFITPTGTYRWKRVPQGLKGSGSYFQSKMNEVIGGELLFNGVEVYLDDILVYGNTQREYLDNLSKLLQRFKDYGVRLSPKKCIFGVPEVEYVGHVINNLGHTFSEKKKAHCLNFPKPTTHKHMKGFLGLANYFRDNIPNMSTLVQPLQDMISGYTRGTALKWTPTLDQHYEDVQHALGTCQHLYWMDEDLPVFLHTDASDYGCGGYLFQKDESGKEYPIHFLSKSFSAVQKRWSPSRRATQSSLRSQLTLLRDRKFTPHRPQKPAVPQRTGFR
jgi:hypothetical protein